MYLHDGNFSLILLSYTAVYHHRPSFIFTQKETRYTDNNNNNDKCVERKEMKKERGKGNHIKKQIDREQVKSLIVASAD